MPYIELSYDKILEEISEYIDNNKIKLKKKQKSERIIINQKK